MFDHRKVEPIIKDFWDSSGVYRTSSTSQKKKKYILDMFPYPSGDGLHVGHPLGYIGSDIVARYYRMKGFNVLHPMGWDAFGLPAENYAIKMGIHPKVSTQRAIEQFKQQLKNIGLSYDWDKEINTSSEEYYKWTQWLFLKFFENDLAYLAEAPVNWCPQCMTVLANEQVVKKTEADMSENVCERCDTPVIKKNLTQWFFKITDYAEELIDDLNKLDWPESTKVSQKNWIGKSSGAEIQFKLENAGDEDSLTVFTTRPDTIFGVSFIAVAPEVAEKKSMFTHSNVNIEALKAYIEKSRNKTEIERGSTSNKTGVFTGLYAKNTLSGASVPVWVADFVLPHYGTGVVMGVPAHDARDFLFAENHDLPIKSVVKSNAGEEDGNLPYEGEGILQDSGDFSGIHSDEAATKIIKKLEDDGDGKAFVTYKLRDWLVSRQRYWGPPIPIIYCMHCTDSGRYKVTKRGKDVYALVPVSNVDLPLTLPDDIDFRPDGESPLASSRSFHTVSCPNCGKTGEGVFRESDTLDTFVDSSWYFFRYPDAHNSNNFSSAENINNWLPVDIYVGGAEHTVLHLLYSRFVTKALRDLGEVSISEPFHALRHQGMILGTDGRKMSKRWGNVINPDDVVLEIGADTLRVYEMFMGPFNNVLEWNTDGINGTKRFINRVWKVWQDTKDANLDTSDAVRRKLHKTIEKVERGIVNFSFNTGIAAMMEFLNVLEDDGESCSREDFIVFSQVLAPFAPFITEKIWLEYQSELGGEENTSSIHTSSWPEANEMFLIDDIIEIAIQIDGKFRGVVKFENRQGVFMENEVLQAVCEDASISKYVPESHDVVYVQNKVLNFISV